MNKIFIKALSVNALYSGRRFTTPEYKRYKADVMCQLPKMRLPEPPYSIFFEFSVSNSNCDLDNMLKGIIDILQLKYKFNDNTIYEIICRKAIVKKGKESITFSIVRFD